MGIVLIFPVCITVFLTINIAKYSIKYQSRYREKHNIVDNGLYIPVSMLISLIGISVGNFYVTGVEAKGIKIFHSTEELMTATSMFCIAPLFGFLISNITILFQSIHIA